MRADLKQESFLQDKIRQLVDNKNRIVIVQTPNPNYEKQQLDQEQELSKSLLVSEKLPTPDAAPASILPTLTVDDILKTIERVDVKQDAKNVFRNTDKTNGIVYVTLFATLADEKGIFDF